jgi:TRAP-type transport system periplasmic protein
MGRKSGQVLGAIALATSMTIAVVAQAAELKMLTSWPPNNTGTRVTELAFMAMVPEESKGSLTLKLSGPEAVPSFEQLQPVAAGVFDLLITHGAYHYGSTGIGVALDAVNSDPVKRRESGVWDLADKHYQRLGLKAIAFVPQGKSGYQMILRDPVGPDGGLKGRKIRGTASYHPLIKALGGAPVVIPPTDVYTAMEKGVVDGAAWPTVGVIEMKWTEVAKYYLRPSFGVSTLQIFMNLNKFNSLSDADKKAILEAGRKIELKIYGDFDKMAEDETAGMQKAGMKEARFSKENEAQIGKLWKEDIWKLAITKNKAEAEAMRKFVSDKKMGM